MTIITNLILWCQANSSALLTAVGVSSGLGAVISAIGATVQAVNKLDEKKESSGGDITPGETFMLLAPLYIPTVVLLGTSTVCFVMNTIKAERKIATLAGLYSMSEKSFTEYRKKVEDMFGKKKEIKVRDEIASDKARTAIANQVPYIVTGDGNYPVLDAWSNTKFRSSQLRIEKARIEIMDRLRSEMYISLAEVYDEMGLPIRIDDNGYPLIDRSDIGWTVDDGLEFNYTYVGDDEGNGEPMMVITFSPPPHPNYNRTW